jgi:tRNA G37 N-methylase Trm5
MPNKLKKLLRKKLTKKQLALLPSSYDVVGSIIIFSDFPEELIKKEKVIAESLLLLHKNIKTICKKTKKYSGKYRTPKLKIIAGENTKETIHKENKCRLKLDVEKVYFSTRLSEERKRIAGQVKKEEDVLVMFSGCAPYPCVISKNTKAREIFGIEANSIGHKYGMENLKLNRIHNVVLINADVRDAMPLIFHYTIGLKSSDRAIQLGKRLRYHPVVMEIHLFDDDLSKGKEKLEKTIEELKSKGINIVLHMPFCYDGKRYSLAKKDVSREFAMLYTLGGLCKKHHVKAVVHPVQETREKEDEKAITSISRTPLRAYSQKHLM